MRIKRVIQGNFRKSELTLYKDFAAENKTFVQSLTSNDVIAFVSRTGNQLLFVSGFDSIKTANDTELVLPSKKYRILHGTWHYQMLRNYAEAAGLKIDGLKLFEEYHTKLTRK